MSVCNDPLISLSTLGQFLSVLDPSLDEDMSESTIVERMSDPTFLHKIFVILGQELPPSTTLEDFILSLNPYVDDDRYKASVKQLYKHISDNSSQNFCLRLGEIIIGLSVDSPNSTEIVERIMTRLDESTQIEIQRTIEHFALESPSSTDSLEGSRLSEVSRNPSEGSLRIKSSPSSIVPRIPLNLIHKYRSYRTGRRATIEKASLRSPLKPTSNSPKFADKEEGEESEGQSLWKQKFDSLRVECNSLEEHRDQILQELEQTKKNFAELNHNNSVLKAQLKVQVTAGSQRNMAEIVETLEREVGAMKGLIVDLKREKKESEKDFEQKLAELRDENQVISANAEQMPQLIATIEKYRLKLVELPELKNRLAAVQKSLEEYMEGMLVAQEEAKDVPELKKSVDVYKTKCAELETNLSTAKWTVEDLTKRLAQFTTAAEDTRKLHELECKAIKAEYEEKLMQDAAGSNMNDGFLKDIMNKEKVMRLEREVAALRKGGTVPGDTASINELENKLDDTLRQKNKLEADYKSVLAQLEFVRSSEGNDVTQDFLVLQSQLEQEKSKSAVLEDSIRARLESQYQSAIATLKEQLQSRERNLNYVQLSREEQTAVHRRELRIMASAFHELGLKYFQLKSERDANARQYEAVMMKLEKQETQLQIPSSTF